MAAPGSCLILLALKAILLAAAKAGVNRGDSARTTVAAEGKVIPVFETWSSHWFVGVVGAVGVAVPDPVKRKEMFSLSSSKIEKNFKGSLDLIPSPLPSVKIQIMCVKVCLRCKGKTLVGAVNKLLKTKSLLTSPSNVLHYSLT